MEERADVYWELWKKMSSARAKAFAAARAGGDVQSVYLSIVMEERRAFDEFVKALPNE